LLTPLIPLAARRSSTTRCSPTSARARSSTAAATRRRSYRPASASSSASATRRAATTARRRSSRPTCASSSPLAPASLLLALKPQQDADELDLLQPHHRDWLQAPLDRLPPARSLPDRDGPRLPPAVALPPELCSRGLERPSHQRFVPRCVVLACRSVTAARVEPFALADGLGTVGNWHIGLLARIQLVFLLDETTRPLPAAMKTWVDVINWVKMQAWGEDSSGLTFFTCAHSLFDPIRRVSSQADAAATLQILRDVHLDPRLPPLQPSPPALVRLRLSRAAPRRSRSALTLSTTSLAGSRSSSSAGASDPGRPTAFPPSTSRLPRSALGAGVCASALRPGVDRVPDDLEARDRRCPHPRL